MKRIRIIGIMAVLALIAAACSPDTADSTTTSQAADTTTTAPPSGDTTTTTDNGDEEPDDNPLAEWGENPGDADMSLIAKALGPVEPSDEASWNIILAAVARAHQDLDEDTITKAMECHTQPQCDTGTGGDLVMGYADGGGNDVNVWRKVSHMEAVLQALTYPEIGRIVSTAADFAEDTNVPINDIRFLINSNVDFIVGYPDTGTNLSAVITEAADAGIPYFAWSAGWVGLPDQEGALIPGEDYPTVVGEDLCALGTSFAEVLNDGVGEGQVALLGGSSNNALSLGWQRCTIDGLSSSVDLVNPPPNRDTTTGDTFWYPPMIPGIIGGLLDQNPEIRGWAYEYADGMYFGLDQWSDRNLPFENMTIALRTDEQNLFCDWVDRNEPTYNIWYSAGGNFQSRVAVTAAVMHSQGFTPPAEIVVPHVMRQVQASDCDPDRPNAAASGTSLVPDDVMRRMFAGT